MASNILVCNTEDFDYVLARLHTAHCTEVRFASLLSGGFITAIVVNPPERKLAKRTCAVFRIQSVKETPPHLQEYSSRFFFQVVSILDSGINVGPTFINFGFFYRLTKRPCVYLIQHQKSDNIIFSSFYITKDLKFLPNFPCPTLIQGPIFIILVKFSMSYVYSLPYVYSGVQSTIDREKIVKALGLSKQAGPGKCGGIFEFR